MLIVSFRNKGLLGPMKLKLFEGWFHGLIFQITPFPYTPRFVSRTHECCLQFPSRYGDGFLIDMLTNMRRRQIMVEKGH